MAGTALNLSLLSRGVGEVKRNGTEKVDVVLEPGDYFNYAIDSKDLYFTPVPAKAALPPISKSLPHGFPIATPRELHEVNLPKTFTTRKGALLLFSEDFAMKTHQEDDKLDSSRHVPTFEELNLHTVDDLTKTILSYGSHRDEVNLKFVKEARSHRRFRPGYSARRYLSKLTRSLDSTFLDNLITKGYVNEKSMYQFNSLVPHIRRRIDDDISSLPAPYRIMRQMLLAPGILSGYNFFTGRRDTTLSDLTTVPEDGEEDYDKQSIKSQKIQVVEMNEGIAKTVTYSDLSKDEKENVLADLLVKSAINYAFEKEKQKMLDGDGSSEGYSPTNQEPQPDTASRRQSVKSEDILDQFDMAEAVRSYLESQIDTDSLPAVQDSSRGSLKGSKVSSHSSKSFGENEDDEGDTARQTKTQAPDQLVNKEYIGGVPVVSMKDVISSNGSLQSTKSSPQDTTAEQQPYLPHINQIVPSPLSTIHDVDDTMLQSRETTFNFTPVLPPIRPVVQMIDLPLLRPTDNNNGPPMVNVLPPTPQHSTLTQAGTVHKPNSREPTMMEKTEEESVNVDDDEGTEREVWQGDIDEGEMLQSSRSDTTHRKAPLTKKASTQSMLSTLSLDSGPVVGGGSLLQGSTESLTSDLIGDQPTSHRKMRGNALRTVQKRPLSGRSKVSNKKYGSDTSSVKGSVIFGPDGRPMNVGGSILTGNEQDVSPVKNEQDPTSGLAKSGAESEEEEEGWGGRMSRESFNQKMGGFAKPRALQQKPVHHTKKNTEVADVEKDIDHTSGDFDATMSMHGWAYSAVSEPDQGLINAESLESLHPVEDAVGGGGDGEVVTEQQLVEALTEHAHAIASTVLTQTGHGRDLGNDAQAAAEFWVDNNPKVSSGSTSRLSGLEDTAVIQQYLHDEGVTRDTPAPNGQMEQLRQTLTSVVSMMAGEDGVVTENTSVSPEVIKALTNQTLSPDDIEIVSDSDGKSVIRVKSGHSQVGTQETTIKGVKEGHIYTQPNQREGSGTPTDGPPPSIPADRAAEADVGEPHVIHYKGSEGKRDSSGIDTASKKSAKSLHSGKGSNAGTSNRATSVTKSEAGKSVVSFKDDVTVASGDKDVTQMRTLEKSATSQRSAQSQQPSVKSGKSEHSLVVSEKSKHSLQDADRVKSSLEDREEFVVGKVKDTKENEDLYGMKGEPPKPKPKKPRVPPAKPAVKKAAKKPAVKKAAKKLKGETKKKTKPAEEEIKNEPVAEIQPEKIEEVRVPSPVRPIPVIATPISPIKQEPSPAPSIAAKSEEEMEFIFVDDEFPEPPEDVSDQEQKSMKSAKSVISHKSAKSMVSIATSGTEPEDDDDEDDINQITNREARAKARAARAARKKEEVARKRREREEQLKRQKEEAERKEQMLRDLEEERRRREEEKRLARERANAEDERQMREEEERKRRQQLEAERDRRMKEEYQRKLEEMRRKQQEEERRKRELEEERRLEEEERRRLEEIMLSQMREEERLEYEKRKKEEEEERLRLEEEQRLRREEEARLAMEEAKRLAEEMARKQIEFERRMQFNRALRLEAEGMESHSHNINRAFVFSYFELLRWLGLEVPDIEALKARFSSNF